MQFASYYKLPVPQTTQENCVAHNGSLVPVPGRDILVQAWYQGGISLTRLHRLGQPGRDRLLRPGPDQPDVARPRRLLVGLLVQRRRLRQRDRPRLRRVRAAPSEHLSEAEIAAAGEVQLAEFNPQHQTAFTWEPSFAVARARFDQLARTCTSTVTGRHNGPLAVSGITCLDGATVSGPVVGAARCVAALARTRRSAGRVSASGASARAPVRDHRAGTGLHQRRHRQRRRGRLDRPRPGVAGEQRHRRRRADRRPQHDQRTARPAPGTPRRRSTSAPPTPCGARPPASARGSI